ncbi:hypoxanthine phosphoribosyltransferase [Pedobacter montanisoli]|uniref:Hypoxanthine phosphoribosyltransferase n=1 Tax=Pedobacter montanisoli TaxID=2923277 RepID=A0ABS9ZV31_9SPHI|nr:hypoxanthine phosphoribosyltransferase [Pedobacter montanisoli]MCJ0741533.1 hypoxanthine phosphoribosyltransferase [Pedobacter montanisoli]
MDRIEIHQKAFELFLDADAIAKRIRLLAVQLNLDYENKIPVFVGVLNGGFLFLADLIKEINIPCEIEFIKVSSYKGQESTGTLRQSFALPTNLQNRHVILVEDIVDTGFTINNLVNKVKEHKPASVATCTLLFKPDALKEKIDPLTYIAFEIPPAFVVGYGLDFDGLGRNLKDIYRAV